MTFRPHNSPDRVNPQTVENLNPGEIITIKIDMHKGRYRSADKDLNEPVFYEAPPGIVIYDHDIVHTGNNSATWWVKTVQAGAISFEHGVAAKLSEKIKEGMLGGKLTWKGAKLFEGDASANYSNFLKEFSALYRFRAHTNSSIHFRWNIRTKRGRYGAWIDSLAYVRLMRVNTTLDAARALQVIEFALASGTTEDLFSLMENVLGGKKTAKELDFQPDEVDPDLEPDLEVDTEVPPSRDICHDAPIPDTPEPISQNEG
ncbi:hypothetical protein JWJ88_14835 [Paracoccus methylovorus]|uniref:Uncharacterized protein n=1 Tax=Paracoccus methylovorus TaxID=2812658 RepID=A0ABX7JQS4_9RHOB|nr:hypothetical protein [Paracoccus methylovorus]QRZ15603.1 hypothetical protein JWJ88_14835 [Paracoccus methylovorus]